MQCTLYTPVFPTVLRSVSLLSLNCWRQLAEVCLYDLVAISRMTVDRHADPGLRGGGGQTCSVIAHSPHPPHIERIVSKQRQSNTGTHPLQGYQWQNQKKTNIYLDDQLWKALFVTCGQSAPLATFDCVVPSCRQHLLNLLLP